jgi:hypothetical protein
VVQVHLGPPPFPTARGPLGSSVGGPGRQMGGGGMKRVVLLAVAALAAARFARRRREDDEDLWTVATQAPDLR